MTPPRRIRFGTDGLRGVANVDLTPELVLALGRAAVRVLGVPAVVLGRDTRISGSMLSAAFAAGACAQGADIHDAGVVPTPAVAWLAARDGLPGAVVSASHNPFGDNGVKLFGVGGTKLAPDVEAAIEDALDACLADREVPGALDVGAVRVEGTAGDDYREHLLGNLAGRRLEGLRLVVDAANGAASAIAAGLFESAGAKVTAIHSEPDGRNINAGCGSTHLGSLADAVAECGADLGLALDGDADRLLAVDGEGRLVDGDRLLALFAADLAEGPGVAGGTVVVTVMSNLGLRLALEARGISVIETPVGDRHVLNELDARGLVLGGEQSGHLIFRDRATTGDGLLTGLLLADLVVRAGRPLAELAGATFDRVPQALVNVRVADASALEHDEAITDAIEAERAALGSEGRVLVRASGTEPLVRVMVEAPGDGRCDAVAERLAAVVATRLGAGGAPPGAGGAG